MYRTIFPVVLFSLVVLSLSCNRKQQQFRDKPVSRNDREIKVMSYNIHHANPPSRTGFIDTDAIVAVLRQEQPDLVALQEIDVNTHRAGDSLNEAADIAGKLGMHFYFGKAIDYDGGEYGVAILSRYPFTATETYKLPTAEGTRGEPRVLAVVHIRVPGSAELAFACTHLDAQRSDTNRLLQIRAIDSILMKEKLPVIIGGDFNAEAGGGVIAVLDRGFTRTCTGDCQPTIPSDKPRKTIDFLAFRPAGKFSVKKHAVLPAPYPSDHLPVAATLGFQ